MDMKICSSCKIEKQDSDFHKRRGADSLQAACKTCRKVINARWYQENKEPHNTKRQVWKKLRSVGNMEKLVAFLQQHPCVDCGEDDPLVLEFDHVRGEKEFDVSRMVQGRSSSWASIEKEIAKCEVRCANCHRRKTVKERNDLRYQILCRVL